MRTSISDYKEYKSACLRAVEEEDFYKNFKTHPDYFPIVPGIHHQDFIEYGKKYVQIINESNFNFDKLDLIKKNDLMGNDHLEDYGPPYNKISTVTLRYLKVLVEIESVFGNFDNKDVIEIGGGYGGQCFLFMNYFKPKSYTIIDLPEALRLSEKYLLEFSNINFISYNQINILENNNYDLAISNYAFSECEKKLQLDYINIFKKCKNGYVTYNQISGLFGINSLSADEFLSIMNCKIMEETPKTNEKNLILYW